MTSNAARMPIVKCYLSQAMLARLASLADKAGRELGRTVERAAVIRTAMTAWLHHTKALPIADIVQTIRRAMRVEHKSTRRRRLTVRWTEGTARRLVDLTFNIRPWLHRAPPPSALVRAALAFWIDAAEQRSPSVLAQEILLGLAKRGRKKANFLRIPNGT
jgi:hypothetical protein